MGAEMGVAVRGCGVEVELAVWGGVELRVVEDCHPLYDGVAGYRSSKIKSCVEIPPGCQRLLVTDGAVSAQRECSFVLKRRKISGRLLPWTSACPARSQKSWPPGPKDRRSQRQSK